MGTLGQGRPMPQSSVSTPQNVFLIAYKVMTHSQLSSFHSNIIFLHPVVYLPLIEPRNRKTNYSYLDEDSRDIRDMHVLPAGDKSPDKEISIT